MSHTLARERVHLHCRELTCAADALDSEVSSCDIGLACAIGAVAGDEAPALDKETCAES